MEIDTLKINMELKEDIAVLEKMNKDLRDIAISVAMIPNMVHSNLKLLSMMCSEQIKAQKEEESWQEKFETVEQFALHMGLMVDLILKHLEDKHLTSGEEEGDIK